MAVSAFEYSNPRVERIVFGRGVVNQLADEVRQLGAERVFVVTSPSIARSYLLEAVRSALGDLCVGVYDTVKPHSPTDSIAVAAKQAADASADAFVSVGGGSSIDTAKGMAALLAEGRPLKDLATHFIPPDKKEVPDMPAPKMPHIAIPTTFSGGEYSYSAGLAEGGLKLILADAKLSPRVVLLDPEAAQTAPAKLLAASGMNALAHCVEAIYSTQTQILSQAYCMAAVGPIATYLPRLVADMNDLEAIGEMQVAATLSSMGVYSAWTGIHHGIVHVIGGRFTVPSRQHPRADAALRHALEPGRHHRGHGPHRPGHGGQRARRRQGRGRGARGGLRHEREDGAAAAAPGPGDSPGRVAVPGRGGAG